VSDADNIIQGRPIGGAELQQIRQLLAEHPEWSRWRLSRELARSWNWCNAAGQLKDMAARTLLLKLEQRGLIQLPARRSTPSNRMRDKRLPDLDWVVDQRPVIGPLEALLPLSIRECSGTDPKAVGHRVLFDVLLHRHHYLSHRSSVGENLQYLVCDAQTRPLACVLFGAAAWQCAARDRFVGWESAQRAAHLHLIANNTRFLILPWVQVYPLASHLLSRITQRLSRDWLTKYGHPIYLLETFVEHDRFSGAAYRAANWLCVGQTKGRTRQDRPDGTWYQTAVKDVYLYPLARSFRPRLQAQTPNSHPHNDPAHDGHSTPHRCALPPDSPSAQP
jgi:hypothetical protein